MKTESKDWQYAVSFLARTARNKNITQQQIADKIGKDQGYVSMFFGLKHCPSMRNFIDIAKVVGVTIEMNDLMNTVMKVSAK